MALSASEENKNKVIASLISLAFLALLILFMILYSIITPNPPFPAAGGGGSPEISLGMMDVGNDNVEYGAIGKVTDVVSETPQTQEMITDPNGDVETPIENKPKVENNTTVITPVKPVEQPKPKTAAELLAEKFNKNKGKNGGGIGNNSEAGQEGGPDGNPNSHGNGGGGTGGGDGSGDGPDKGPGKGHGTGGYGVSLAGRKVLSPPQLPKDTKEEGKVVVEITVDGNGNVIKADPNGRGTTTNSAILKQKAKNAAMLTKFNPNSDYEEQRGTITIIFSF